MTTEQDKIFESALVEYLEGRYLFKAPSVTPGRWGAMDWMRIYRLTDTAIEAQWRELRAAGYTPSAALCRELESKYREELKHKGRYGVAETIL